MVACHTEERGRSVEVGTELTDVGEVTGCEALDAELVGHALTRRDLPGDVAQ